ncbi:MAG: GxxExxY protein [Pirellulales bacterium]|nr:GxxExxY protein [Pirellulales bacterium]
MRETSFAIHNYLRHGHLEKVYERALAHRLAKIGLIVHTRHPLSVYDEDGTILGEYYVDLLIGNCLIVEIKACNAIVNDHIAQMIGYLRSSGKEHGLLINFGAPRLFIKKYIFTLDQNNSPPDEM